jgi:arsenite-transporting ATPase
VLQAPYFDQEVIGAEMLDRLALELFDADELDPAAVLHDTVTQRLEVSADGARLRLPLPFTSKADIVLKKIGLELIVGVDGHRRTIMLPSSMVGFRPADATFEEGALEVRFENGGHEQAVADAAATSGSANGR